MKQLLELSLFDGSYGIDIKQAVLYNKGFDSTTFCSDLIWYDSHKLSGTKMYPSYSQDI